MRAPPASACWRHRSAAIAGTQDPRASNSRVRTKAAPCASVLLRSRSLRPRGNVVGVRHAELGLPRDQLAFGLGLRDGLVDGFVEFRVSLAEAARHRLEFIR